MSVGNSMAMGIGSKDGVSGKGVETWGKGVEAWGKGVEAWESSGMMDRGWGRSGVGWW